VAVPLKTPLLSVSISGKGHEIGHLSAPECPKGRGKSNGKRGTAALRAAVPLFPFHSQDKNLDFANTLRGRPGLSKSQHLPARAPIP
jgi:hypothetical protein